MDAKICFKCKIEWPIHFYYKHSQMKDGHLNKCKKCTKKDSTQRRNDNLEYVKEYDRLRQNKPERREKKLIYTETFRNKHPEKYKAYTAVSNALRDGKLIKLPCCVCGDLESQAHHEDYKKPLEVVWVCIKHHREIE